MRPTLVLFPDDETVSMIVRLRKRIVEEKMGDKDPRADVLPHTTVLYIEKDINAEQIGDLLKKLKQTNISQPFSLRITGFTNWEHKIVAMIDTEPLQQLKRELEKISDIVGIKSNTRYKSFYGDTVGDHIKLVRGVKLESIKDVVEIFKSEMPQKILFARIALLGYEGEEKDIIWQRQLNKKQ